MRCLYRFVIAQSGDEHNECTVYSIAFYFHITAIVLH